MQYVRRFADDELDDMLGGLAAIAIEGAKGVGKTATATSRAGQVFSLDDPATRTLLEGDPGLILRGTATTFVDEWQRFPPIWDVIRHAVDDGAGPGRFLLAGSATPDPASPIHSGAGRIVRLLMRPMSLPERGFETPTVSLRSLLEGAAEVEGSTTRTTADYAEQIVASGFPGIRSAPQAARVRLLDSYIDRIVDHDIPDLGVSVRRPASLLAWLTAYAAATSTTASYSSLLGAATPGEDVKPAKPTAIVYRDLLQRLWVLDPLQAWSPAFATIKSLAQAPKHHLVDPALAARLLGVTADSLLRGDGPSHRGPLLGALFESLAAQTVRVLAQIQGARVFHMRLQGGAHEVDLIVQRPDQKVMAIEVKLSSAVRPADVAQLNWLEHQVPGLVVDKVLLNTGAFAYRRKDGVAVIPLALLGT